MQIIAAAAGVGLLLVVLHDMVWTTVAASGGAGPLTGRLTHGMWVVARRLFANGEGDRRLRLAGITIVTLSIGAWILLLWVAWSLIFFGSQGAVLVASSGQPASLMDRIYFAGYTLSTLGNGEFAPGGGLWQVATVIASFNGIAMLTLGVSYVVPVVSAVTSRRQIALRVAGLGATPSEIINSTYDPESGSWQPLERDLAALASEFAGLGQQHLAYPVLHYFHDLERDAAIAVAVAVLDETLTLLRHGVAEEARPNGATLRAARSSLTMFLNALTAAFIAPAEHAPQGPSLAELKGGPPVVERSEYLEALRDLEGRRRVLHGFVLDDGWSWQAVVADGIELAEGKEPPDTVETAPADAQGREQADESREQRGVDRQERPESRERRDESRDQVDARS